jgi:site-specific DNA-methyltransferase (cytosine-N4-specific)
VFAEVWRVLKDDGTCWLNLGDSYANSASGRTQDGFNARYFNRPDWNKGKQSDAAVTKPDRLIPDGLKPKDLIGIPWRVAFALQAAGWYLRSDIIWSKPNPMPESVTDRPTKAHEYIFLLAKQDRYYYNADAIKEPHVTGDRLDKWEGRTYDGKGPSDGSERKKNGNAAAYTMDPLGRNKRSVWHVATQPYNGSHFATFPEALIEPCILAGSRPGDLVYDPFIGSGTVGAVCDRLMRRWVGSDLHYQHLARERTAQRGLRLA